MSIIAFANQKGGVGKTMTVAAVASVLVQSGNRVLLVDLDAQRNLDMVAGEMGCETLEIKRNDTSSFSVLDVLKGDCTISEAIVPSALGDLVRASNSLYGWTGNKNISGTQYISMCDNLQKIENICKETSNYDDGTNNAIQALIDVRAAITRMKPHFLRNGKTTFEDTSPVDFDSKILENALAPIKDQYDYILIDTNPSLTLLTLNALYACEYVVIPTFPESSAVEAILELYDTIKLIQKNEPSRSLQIAGVLTTKYSPTRKKSKRHDSILKEVVEQMMQSYLFDVKIRDTEVASTYVEANMDVVRLAPTCNTALDYRAFVDELKIRLASINL